MKRLGVLCVLAMALALPAMAAPVVVTGDVTAGWIGDFGTNTDFQGDLNLYFKAAVDDFNAVSVTVGRADETDLAMKLEAATLTTDVGKFLKIDPKMLAWTVVAGYTSAADNSYVSQSGYGEEDVGGAGTATAWMGYTTVKLVDLINIKFGILPQQILTGVTTDMVVGAYVSKALGTIGTLNAEVFWDNFDELIVADGRFDLTPAKDLTIGIGAGFKYDLTVPASYGIGASLKAKYGTMGDLAVGFGYYSAADDWLAVQATINAVQPFDFYAGLKLNLSGGGAPVFNCAEVAAKLNLGAADIYVGYALQNGTTGAEYRWAPENELPATSNGGLYVKLTTAF